MSGRRRNGRCGNAFGRSDHDDNEIKMNRWKVEIAHNFVKSDQNLVRNCLGEVCMKENYELRNFSWSLLVSMYVSSVTVNTYFLIHVFFYFKRSCEAPGNCPVCHPLKPPLTDLYWTMYMDSPPIPWVWLCRSLSKPSVIQARYYKILFYVGVSFNNLY